MCSPSPSDKGCVGKSREETPSLLLCQHTALLSAPMDLALGQGFSRVSFPCRHWNNWPHLNTFKVFNLAPHWKIQPCGSQQGLLSTSEIPGSDLGVLKRPEAHWMSILTNPILLLLSVSRDNYLLEDDFTGPAYLWGCWAVVNWFWYVTGFPIAQ